MFTQVKLYIYGAIALIIIALSTTVYIQRARISVLNSNVDKCIEANEASTETIKELKKERTKASKSCALQMGGYEATLAWLRNIDNHKGGNYVQDGEGVIVSNSGDDLRDALGMLFPMPGGDENGIYQTGSTADTESTRVLSGAVFYCFSTNSDVKNFLKNNALDRGYEKRLVDTIEGLR